MSDAAYHAVTRARPRPSAGIAHLTDDAIEAIESARGAEDVYAFLGTLCGRTGFDYFAYLATDPLRPAMDPMAGTSYPGAWRERYLRLGYQHHDPVLSAGSSMRRPFVWGDRQYVNRLEGEARRIFEDAHAFGIGGGVSVPVYGPGGDHGLLSLSCREAGEGFASLVRETMPILHVVAHRVHAVMMERLLQPPQPQVRLTAQERECLAWTLRGKTAWEIAHIMGRSRATVNFHLQKSLRKLGTSSKHQAATKAMRAGLI